MSASAPSTAGLPARTRSSTNCCGCLAELRAAADQALARTDGHGLEELLRAFGQSFAEHARYANLLLKRRPDAAAQRRIQQAIGTLTARAVAAGAIAPGITAADVRSLASALRGLVQAGPGQAGPGRADPASWQRFLDLHLAGMRADPG